MLYVALRPLIMGFTLTVSHVQLVDAKLGHRNTLQHSLLGMIALNM